MPPSSSIADHQQDVDRLFPVGARILAGRSWLFSCPRPVVEDLVGPGDALVEFWAPEETRSAILRWTGRKWLSVDGEDPGFEVQPVTKDDDEFKVMKARRKEFLAS